MEVIFTGNVSKEGQRIVKAGREREGKHSHTEAGHFVYGQYCQHFSSQRESTIFLFFILSFFNEWIFATTKMNPNLCPRYLLLLKALTY